MDRFETIILSRQRWIQVIEETQTLFRLAIPLILAQLAHMSMGFVDTAMTGNYNALDLAAVAIGDKSVIVVVLFGFGLITSVQILVAQLHGGHVEPEQIGLHVVQGIWVGQMYGILGWFVVRNILPFMTFLQMEPEVFALAQGYMEAFSWGLPATFLFISFRVFYEGLSISRLTFYFTCLGLLVNILGNYMLIFGHFGAPEMGAVGAGWTSALANWAMALGIILYTMIKKRYVKYHIFSQLRHFSWKTIKSILQVGTPIGISFFIEVSMFALFSLMMARFGVTVLAANQIALNYAALIFMVPLGLAMATTIRIGNALGKNSMQQANLIGVISVILGGLLMSISCIVLLLFPAHIALIYSKDEAVIAVAVKLMILVGISQISDGIQVTAAGVLRAWKDTKFVMLSALISFWGVGLSLGYLIGIKLEYGAEGLWFSMIMGLVVMAVSLCTRFYFISRQKS